MVQLLVGPGAPEGETVSAPAAAVAAARLHVCGVVQGVGFRPFVHRLAARYRLAGWVQNASGDVQIEVEGPAEAIADFTQALEREAPPLARIERVRLEGIPPAGRGPFAIQPSAAESDRRQPISPDVALCAACEAELFDPANRRHHYPFITCTDCGPRFTVIEAMPYDRERTSMRAFAQCPECLREYRDPTSRRYHSETNSCTTCGPRVWLAGGGIVRHRPDAIGAAARLLRAGLTIAVRGLGGFHLACDATDEQAVRRLRARKRRDAKPLAIMVRTLEQARALASITPEEAELLASRERPIVLLRRRPGATLAPSIAPGLDTVGVMLAYTPLHHLLLDRVDRPLVMTSGNLSEEPIATANDDAVRRLAGIADAFLLHDRDIVARYDDSVLRLAGGTPLFLRRARGYAPLPVDLPVASPLPLVAVGPHLKNTFALVHGRRAWVSQHIGDLENLETLEHFQSTLGDFRRLFHVEPAVAVRDLHPGYLSTRVAGELGLERIIPVQHHHAHIAAVLAEHGRTTAALGIAFDGTGYGDDTRVWGAEFLVADLAGYARVGRLRYVPLAGGILPRATPGGSPAATSPSSHQLLRRWPRRSSAWIHARSTWSTNSSPPGSTPRSLLRWAACSTRPQRCWECARPRSTKGRRRWSSRRSPEPARPLRSRFPSDPVPTASPSSIRCRCSSRSARRARVASTRPSWPPPSTRASPRPPRSSPPGPRVRLVWTSWRWAAVVSRTRASSPRSRGDSRHGGSRCSSPANSPPTTAR